MEYDYGNQGCVFSWTTVALGTALFASVALVFYAVGWIVERGLGYHMLAAAAAFAVWAACCCIVADWRAER